MPNNLYLAADKRGILLGLYYGSEPPKLVNGIYVGTSQCHRMGRLPMQWARTYEVELEPGDIAVVTDLKYEVLYR